VEAEVGLSTHSLIAHDPPPSPLAREGGGGRWCVPGVALLTRGDTAEGIQGAEASSYEDCPGERERVRAEHHCRVSMRPCPFPAIPIPEPSVHSAHAKSQPATVGSAIEPRFLILIETASRRNAPCGAIRAKSATLSRVTCRRCRVFPLAHTRTTGRTRCSGGIPRTCGARGARRRSRARTDWW
jgi:hypothetical protein